MVILGRISPRSSSRMGGVSLCLGLLLAPATPRAEAPGLAAPDACSAVHPDRPDLTRLPRTAPAGPQCRVLLRLRDASGNPVEARISVYDSAGVPLLPVDDAIPVYDSYFGQDYFYARDTVSVAVPAAAVRVLATRGFEHRPLDFTAVVAADTTLELTFVRFADLRAHGWFSGDTHIHLAHGGDGDVYEIAPEDYATIARAEDLAFSGLLTNGLHFTGGTHPAGDANHLLHFGVEYRSAVYGHLGLLGLDELPVSFGCCLPGTPAAPLNLEVAEWARSRGGVVVYAHPVTTSLDDFFNDVLDWPYSGLARELPAGVARGQVDAYDLLSYSNYAETPARTLWFNLLNLGARIPLSVGTDASVNRWYDPPAGGYRVYVRAGDLTLPSWLDGLRAGRSFATNGPLPFEFAIDGAAPGDVLDLAPNLSTLVTAEYSIASVDPVTTLQIWGDGILLRHQTLPSYTDTLSDRRLDFWLPPSTRWIVARFSGPNPRPTTLGYEQVAYTSPIWITRASVPAGPTVAARSYFDGWITDLQTLILGREGWESETQKLEVWNELEIARLNLQMGTLLAEDHPPPGPRRPPAVSPNPYSLARGGKVRLSLEGMIPAESIPVIDVRGRRVRTLSGTRDAVAWDVRDDTGRPVAPGVYLIVVGAAGALRGVPVVVVP